MTKIAFLAAFAALLLAAPAARAAGPTAGGARLFPYPAHTEKLDNGLTVIVVPMSSGGLVSYWTIVRTGARDEVEPGHSGFAHFFEHMMFRGTEKYPAEVYNAKLTAIGANDNAATWDDYTGYFMGVAAEDLPTVVELESDRFMNLSYPERAFKTEAGAVYGEYRKSKTSPISVLHEALRAKAFTTHTYGHTVIGFEADIQAMPTMYDYSRSFFSRFYRPENCVVLVAGDVEVAPTLALIRRHYGLWKPGLAASVVPPEPEQNAERRLEVSFPGQALPILWLAYKEDRFDPASRSMAALTLLAELAFGETSELYRRLVLEEQSVEQLSAEVGGNRDPGLFDVVAAVKDEDRIAEVEAAIGEAIARLQAAPPDPARLAEIKSRQRYSFLMNLDTPDRVTRSLARIVALTNGTGTGGTPPGGIEAIETLFTTLAAVTPEDVQAAARRYLVPGRRTVGILRGARS